MTYKTTWAFIALVVLLNVAFFGVLGWVAFHFIRKLW